MPHLCRSMRRDCSTTWCMKCTSAKPWLQQLDSQSSAGMSGFVNLKVGVALEILDHKHDDEQKSKMFGLQSKRKLSAEHRCSSARAFVYLKYLKMR